MDETTLTLNSPITEEQWDAMTDVDFRRTNEIIFITKHGKEVKFVKASAQPEVIRCKDCLHWVRTCGDNQWGLGDCDVFDKHLVMCEGYCAWAERREE